MGTFFLQDPAKLRKEEQASMSNRHRIKRSWINYRSHHTPVRLLAGSDCKRHPPSAPTHKQMSSQRTRDCPEIGQFERLEGKK